MCEDADKNRRHFMKGLLVAAGVTMLTPISGIGAGWGKESGLTRLIDAMDKQGRLHEDKLWREQIDNLIYAYQRINPKSHLEHAFVVACGVPRSSTADLVDEYVRRSYGQKSRLYDHPSFVLESWAVPHTQRLLIFREQISALLKELTQPSDRTALRLRYSILQNRLSFNEFKEELSAKYRNYPGDEIRYLYDALYYYIPKSIGYAWCSTIVDRSLC